MPRRSGYLFAVDPSLTCSGWAIFDVAIGEPVAVGKLKSEAPAVPLARRLRTLQEAASGIFVQWNFGDGDVLICEAPTTMRDPRAALRVEQVRCIFEAVARGLGVQVPGRINPRSVQYEVMGLRGKQLQRDLVKEAAVSTAKAVFGKSLSSMGFDPSLAALRKNQDIVDALLIGSLGLERLKAAARAGVSLEELLEEKPMRRRTTWAKAAA